MLNEKQEKFYQNYVVYRNATEAAKQAGYSESSAYNQGYRLLQMEEVLERIEELEQELVAEQLSQQQIEAELGDLMFALVNVSRHLKLDPEATLRRANRKFERRFQQLEQLAAEQELALEQADLEQMEQLWQAVKRQEKAG